MHYSNCHTNYYTAWLYTTKEDESFIQSQYHPDLANRGQARVKRRLPALDDSSPESTGNEVCEEGVEEDMEENRT